MGDSRIISVEDLQLKDNLSQGQLKELYEHITIGMDKLGYSKNRELLNKARELFSQNGMIFEAAHMTKEIGISHYKEGNTARAIKYVENAVDVLRNNTFDHDILETLVSYITSVGVGYYELVNYNASVEAFKKCIHLIDNRISDDILFRYYHEYSIATIYLEKYESALELLERALEYTSNDIVKMAKVYNEMGRCFWMMKKFTDSAKIYNKAKDFFEVKNDNNGLAMIYNNLSILYHTIKDSQKATECIEKCFELFDKTNPKKCVVYFDTYIRISLRKNDFSEAVDRLLYFIELSNKHVFEKRYLLEPIELIVDMLSKFRNEEYGIKLKRIIIDLINELDDIEDKNKHYEERLYSNLGMLRYLYYSRSRRKEVRG